MQQIHLVFDSLTVQELSKALQERDFNVTGKDSTLEQFRIAAEAGQVEASLAIVDATAGVVNKQDSVQILRDIRGFIPDTRLIVLLPVQADREWIQKIGALGIYDVYAVEQFTIDDVVTWIETRKTIRDLEETESDLSGQVPPQMQKKLVSSGSKDSKEAIIRNIRGGLQKIRQYVVKQRQVNASEMEPDIEDVLEPEKVLQKVIYRTKIIGSGVVAVGGLHRRAGVTHTAIQLAVLLVQHGLKTAFVEYRADERPSDIVWLMAEGANGTMFSYEGIDFFPNRTPDTATEVLSLGYDAVVMDAGNLLDDPPAALHEWRRASVQVATVGAAPWDLKRLTESSSLLSDRTNIVVNFASPQMFEDAFEIIKVLKKPVIHNLDGYDPFKPSLSLTPVIKSLLPEKEKRRFFCIFVRGGRELVQKNGSPKEPERLHGGP